MNYKRITDLPGVRIAREAMVVGDATIGEDSCVLFYSTVRGDEGTITIGRETNIQESCTIHASIEGDVVIGDNVTIGHQAVVHGCTVGDRTLIGMAATILDGAEIGCDCIVGAGSLVTKAHPGAGWIAGARKPGEGRAAADGSGEKRYLPQQPGICEGGA